MRSRQILGLDFLRFTAALMVTGFHLCGGTGFEPATWFGWVGVQIFFMLSGFVITYSAQAGGAGAFVRSRLVRLMPGVWICASLTFLVYALAGTPIDTEDYLRTLVLWPTGPWVSAIYWTLPIEFAFYGMVGLVLASGLRSRLPTALMVLGALSTLYWIVRLASTRYGFIVPGGDFVTRYLLLEHGCFFAIGGLLWACLLERTTALRVGCMLLFGAGAMIQVLFAHNGFGGPVVLAPLAAVLLAFAAIVASVKLNRPSRWAPAVRIVGLTTYPLYLLHTNIGAALLQGFDRIMPEALAILLTLSGVIALSAMVAVTVEPALQAWLRSVLAGGVRPVSAPRSEGYASH